jgi:hypothetical protein
MTVMCVNATGVVIERIRCDRADYFIDCVKTRKNWYQICLAEMIDRTLSHSTNYHGLTIRNGGDHRAMAVLVGLAIVVAMVAFRLSGRE